MRRRPDVTGRAALAVFVNWVIGKATQIELDGTTTGRSFRRKIAWCWQVQPQLPIVSTVPEFVTVDGIWIHGWCLLVAIDEHNIPIAWQWSGGESVAAWTALFEQIPEPDVLISDGGTGIPTALATTWPGVKHQRCVFHLQLRTTRHLTRNPRTPAGRALREHVMSLSKVDNIDDAIAWQLRLDEWWRTFGHLTKERTLLVNGRFGFTHDRLRKAWFLVHTVVRNNVLFTWLEHGNPRTTSPLEGGINARIRDMLKHHRGMSEQHQKRAVEWLLATIALGTTGAIKHATLPTAPQTEEPDNDTDDLDLPEAYGTATTAEEGLWNRSGWAGRA